MVCAGAFASSSTGRDRFLPEFTWMRAYHKSGKEPLYGQENHQKDVEKGQPQDHPGRHRRRGEGNEPEEEDRRRQDEGGDEEAVDEGREGEEDAGLEGE